MVFAGEGRGRGLPGGACWGTCWRHRPSASQAPHPWAAHHCLHVITLQQRIPVSWPTPIAAGLKKPEERADLIAYLKEATK